VKEVKKVNKYIIPTAILTGLALTYAEPTFAQTLGATSADPYTLADLAKMFVKGGMILDMFALGTSLLSMPVAGIVGVFNSDLSHDMIQKAMKAIGVTLYFPMVVISLAYLAHLLLGWWDMYLDVWVIFAPCIKPAILEVISQFKP
jgi:hypothetical protein